MVRFNVLGLGLFVLSVAAPHSAGDSKRDSDDIEKKAQELVRKLGDPVFRTREAAARDLLGMGALSRNALEAALTNPDTEIRDALHRPIPISRGQVLRPLLS